MSTQFIETLDFTAPSLGSQRGLAEFRTGSRNLGGPVARFVPEASLQLSEYARHLRNHLDLIALGQRTPWQAIFAPESVGTFLFSTATPRIRISRPQPSLPGIPELLGRIRHYLSLTTTDLASVLLVQRATIYNWQDGAPVRTANLERLNQIYHIASSWWGRYKRPLARGVYSQPVTGVAFLTLLKAEALSVDAIEQQLGVIAADFEASLANRPRRESLAERARRLGRPSVSDETHADTLHFLTHRERPGA
ncbi:MAG TPA: hypothetical protein VK171_13265 [Fimbriimonas sp.]|nr:hypothetical protein [Fimbriimonas sp.]